MFERVQKLLDRLSVRAVFNRLDRRKLQNELDTHKLFLLTSHHLNVSKAKQLSEHYVQELAAQATELKHEADLRQQHHAAVLASPKSRRPRGLAAALGAADPRQSPPVPLTPPHPTPSHKSAAEKRAPALEQPDSGQLMPDDDSTSSESSDSASSSDSDDNSPATASIESRETVAAAAAATSDVGNADVDHQRSRQSVFSPALTLASLSQALKAKLGYSLRVGPSGIAHADAGQGLWLEGRAPVGAVVALYPGLVYNPMHYRRIPGFPKIDTNNDYFLARFDGALIDGHSWTRVGPNAGSMQSISPPETAVHRALLAQLQHLEVRHPLAQAHFANHPPAETQPNVMVAAYDFALKSGEEAWLKAYMPNVMYEEQSAQHTQESAEQPAPSGIVKGLAFVATRELQDEELLLNYRLNPQVQKPDWYSPVDVEEDKRRWY